MSRARACSGVGRENLYEVPLEYVGGMLFVRGVAMLQNTQTRTRFSGSLVIKRNRLRRCLSRTRRSGNKNAQHARMATRREHLHQLHVTHDANMARTTAIQSQALNSQTYAAAHPEASEGRQRRHLVLQQNRHASVLLLLLPQTQTASTSTTIIRGGQDHSTALFSLGELHHRMVPREWGLQRTSLGGDKAVPCPASRRGHTPERGSGVGSQRSSRSNLPIVHRQQFSPSKSRSRRGRSIRE